MCPDFSRRDSKYIQVRQFAALCVTIVGFICSFPVEVAVCNHPVAEMLLSMSQA